MDLRKFEITQDDSGRRIDRIVRRFLPGLALPAVYKLLRKGLVRLDGKKVSPECHVEAGSFLEIAAALYEQTREPDQTRLAPADAGPESFPATGTASLSVLLETPDLLFLNKPAGIPVHGEGGLDRMVPSSASATGSLSFRTGPLHRLDRDTTGLIAFSRSLAGARWFSEGVSGRLFEKYYLGIAEGSVAESGEWTDRTDDGKPMRTLVTPLAHGRGCTLVRFRIITGRKHQIRIQTSIRGHPLAGDTRYGGRRFPSNGGTGTYFLHAWCMVFPPDRPEGLPPSLVAPIPEAFAGAIADFFGPDTLAHIRSGDVYWKAE